MRIVVAVLVGVVGLCSAQRHGDVALPWVDEGVQPISHTLVRGYGGFDVPTFRDARDGWTGNYFGAEVFRTADGGVTWHRAPEVESAVGPGSNLTMIWISSTTGIARRDHGQTIARTLDGGATWRRVPLPGFIAGDGGYSPGANVGNRVWLTGANFPGGPVRGLMRSDDGGATWTVLEQSVGDGSCCRSISFADRDHGWAFTLAGEAIETSDGGAHWRVGTWMRGARLARLMRFTAKAGRAVAWGGHGDDAIDWLTADGGLSWRSRTVEDRPDPRAPIHLARFTVGEATHGLFTTEPASTLREAMTAQLADPAEWNFMAAYGPHGVVRRQINSRHSEPCWEGLLYYFVDGALIRAETPLTAPSGKRERLIGVGSLGGRLRWGWTARRIYLSHDAGATWFRAADATEPLRRVKYLRPGCGVVETSTGRVLRTREWRTTGAKSFDDFSDERCPMDGHARWLNP